MHAGAGFRSEFGGKFASDIVIAQEIVLEVDVLFRRADSIEPGRVVLTAILEQTDVVAGAQRRASGAREHPVGQFTQFRYRSGLPRPFG